MAQSKARLFCLAVILFCGTLSTLLRAHVVEQFYAEYEQGSGIVLMNFDVAYAIPEIRDVELAPQPLREWLVAQSDEQHAALRHEAELYLREYIQFESGGEAIDYMIKFPDFDVIPYAFPRLLNVGAYYNVELIPVLKEGSSDELVISLKEGKFPKLIIAQEKDGETRFETIEQSEKLELELELKLENSVAESDAHGDSETSFSTWQLLVLGFRHVIPAGLDHILFIIGMCLMASTVKQLLWQSLVFTIAHSLSLGLVVSQAFPVYTHSVSGYIEAIIALSIVFIAVESLFTGIGLKWRYPMISVFGFVHGLGFAGSLGSTLQFLSAEHWIVPLILANVGIEVAQVILVIGCFSLLIYLKKNLSENKFNSVRITSAIIIAIFGLMWFFSRLP